MRLWYLARSNVLVVSDSREAVVRGFMYCVPLAQQTAHPLLSLSTNQRFRDNTSTPSSCLRSACVQQCK